MKWDLKPLFKSDADPVIGQSQRSALMASQKFINKWGKRLDYLDNPKILAQALKEYENWLARYGWNDRVSYYFWLRSEQEKNNPQIKAGLNKAKEVAIQIENGIQFFTLNLSQLAKTKQQEFLTAKELIPYRHFLERLFATGRYTKSDQEEKIINQFSDTSYRQWVNMLEAMLAQETRGNKNFPALLAECSNPKKTVRKQAARQINEILAAWAPVAEHELNAVLEYKKVTDEIRRAEEPETLRLVSDDMNKKVIEAMLSTVEKNYKLAERYYRLKAKLLKQKKLSYFERGVPIGKIEKKWTYQEAVVLVRDQLKNLDPELEQIFANFSAQGQIDVYPQIGKTDGAFCAHQSPTLPTYILLNYTNRWRDVKTLAHEVGHGINNELVRKNSRSIYFGTPTSTAEVASTFFEDLVTNALSQKITPKEELALIMAKLDDEVATIFRQVAAYRFEQKLHQEFRSSGYLAKETIGKLWLKQMKDYTGPAVEFPKGSENWWVYWSHFRQFFYVYSYASGLLIAKVLQTKIQQDPTFIKKIKDFLGAGLSASPRELFKQLDLDIVKPNFWQLGLEQFVELLAKAEMLADKLK